MEMNIWLLEPLFILNIQIFNVNPFDGEGGGGGGGGGWMQVFPIVLENGKSFFAN